MQNDYPAIIVNDLRESTLREEAAQGPKENTRNEGFSDKIRVSPHNKAKPYKSGGEDDLSSCLVGNLTPELHHIRFLDLEVFVNID